MKRDEIKKEVISIIADESGYDGNITEGHNLIEDLGMDSLDTVSLMMACEDHFGIEIPDDVMFGIATVGGLIDAIERLQSK